MSLAYHILAHKNPEQVNQLIRVLHHPDDIIVLHFDRRAPRELHALAQRWSREHPNILVQRPRAVQWGGPTISNLQVEAMSLALAANPTWRHFINLTGQDFPLRTRAQLLAALAEKPAANYLSFFSPLENNLWHNARERLARYHLHSPWLNALLFLPGLGRHLRRLLGWQNSIPSLPLYHRTWPDFFPYRGGSNYMILTRAACTYLTTDPLARRIRRWLNHAAHADEILFQSTLHASPLRDTLVNRDYREIDFPLHSPHPRTYTIADLPRLLSSENLFARKFDRTVDAEILNQLETRLRSA